LVAELHETAREAPVLLVAALCGWAVLIGIHSLPTIAAICAPALGRLRFAGLAAAAALTRDASPRFLLSASAMLLAMMAPLLRMPLTQVWHRSLAQRRTRAVMLFTLGYGVPWIIALAALTYLAMCMRALTAARPELALLTIGALAVLWQASPLKRRCLAGCHARRPLRAFGCAADLDALRFGVTAALWCIGTCWALMLLALTLSHAHLIGMAAIAALVLSERSRF
jgi:predicted metal-binding membrane protein